MSPCRVLGGGLFLLALTTSSAFLTSTADAQSQDAVPAFDVDASWPKPLPNNWAVGPVSGIATDARDHIWIIHRAEAVKQAGHVPAPPVIEFDPSGNIVQTWGGPGAGFDWPQQVHGITVDANDRVWISGNGETDTHILVFTRAGKFVRQIGRSGQRGGNDDTANVARATQMRVDIRANEVFVSDGEMNQHHRVIVFNSETGAYKRQWGAYGQKPDDAAATVRVEKAGPPSKHFGTAVHCLRFDRDGLMYVCDRSNNRFQIFRKDGSFQKEVFVARDSGAAGTVYDLDFSPDQRFIYVADGGNQKVWIFRRGDMQVVGSFGERGPGAGQFATSLHDLTVDSNGNVYTGEAAAGGRVQKFALKQAAVRAPSNELFAEIDRGFENFRLDAHVPGLVYGIVMDGQLVHVRGFGIQDIQSKRPVTADTLFRIASMTKSFTALSILKLRDDGRLSLDSLAEAYVPEMREWQYPTEDSPRIRVRDLLTHTAGFVTDDPWGDRQTPLPEAEFTQLLRDGVPFTRPPSTAMEYSNLGYAMLGRIVSNVSKVPYKDYVERTLLVPLGMTSSGFEVERAPAERRALGYRWTEAGWLLEPTMAHGAFGAMGGLQTSAADYSKYVAWLLSAWPPRDGADAGPVKRSSVRELAQGANFPRLRQRPGKSGADACRQPSNYGMGMIVAVDCELGLTLGHGGGYPGYGSFVMLLPDYGVGVFALTNRTYAGPAAPVADAAVALYKAGVLKPRPAATSDALRSAYGAVAKMYDAGEVTAAGDVLAMNFLLDRTAEAWARELASLRSQVGRCESDAPIAATGALSGSFTWRCEHGRLNGSVLLAPTRPPRIQALGLTRALP